MLILPLHRPLNSTTFPFVTVVLILLNLAVFGLFQRGDGERLAALEGWYRSSGMAALEWPGYMQYQAQQKGRGDVLVGEGVEESSRAGLLFHVRLMDVRLQASLQAYAQQLAEPALADLQREYDARLGKIPTYRYLQRNSELDPLRLMTHAFLHGDVMHLIGNMFFLAALGLLVEGALGAWRFSVLYLVGILGSGLFSAAWNWGTPGGGLGASGAIAALMGAFCVLWGTRPVRFFWWFFVVFDYVKKPAIWLLPAWVGWELLNMLLNREAGIAFDAHLGGLLVGALAGWVCVRTDQVRHAFLDEVDVPPDIEAGLAEVRALFGRMDMAEAEVRLAELSELAPQHLGVALASYRAARLANRRSDALQRALRALALPAHDAADVVLQRALLEEALPLDRPVPLGPWRQALRQRWLMLREFGQVEALLERWLADEAEASHWFELALRLRDHGSEADFHRILGCVIERYPTAGEAEKARFLLPNGNL